MSDSERTVFAPRAGAVSVGTTLNGIYEVERLIAVGGMGEVYKGRAIQTGDAVAIKMIRPELARDEAALALFRREAAALHNLYNEAIVRYYVFTIDPGTQSPYLAMEFVDGQPLSERIKEAPLSLDEVDVLRRRIGPGLHAAHLLGIVHRDVSPDNIILPGGSVARAKIIDFGIARSSILGEGTVIGSGFAGKYNYVSPEQLGLYGGDVTGRSDMYSFGLVLAEALTGKPLDMGGSQVQILEKRRRLPDLSGIDARMRPLLARMLAADPAERFADMSEVAAWQPQAPTAKTASGNSPLRAVAGIAALALLAGGGFYGWTVLNDEPPRGNTPPPALNETRSDPPAQAQAQTPAQPSTPAQTSNPAQAQNRVPELVEPPAVPPPAVVAQPPATQTPAIAAPALTEPPAAPAAPPQPPPTQPPPSRPDPQIAVAVPPPVAPPARPDPRMPQPTVTEPVRPPATPAVPPAAQPRPEAPAAATGRSDPAQVAVAQPPRPPIERIQRYVATYDGGPCFFLWPTELTATRAVLEGFGNRTEPFVAFDSAFKAAQGFEAQIHLRPITAAQCPMADFLRALGDNIDRTPRLQINAFNMKSGDVLSGTIDNDGGRNVAVVLIGDDGLVYNLGSYLRRDGRRATFNLKLESAGGGPRPQTVLTFVSAAPLPALSGPNPTPSTDFFASLQQDVARQGGQLGLGVRYFRIE
ncbi:MAG TPA: serine/threonine-protein kinase [Bosea sp. (in: a-proteobacteria)]|jgi:serine/threonine-protein kinase|uniref:serine/threonine-protein kinase n=1 Tax=Bosea sp. (in: a-proteobacteria) TaxID=1871050 RepID=UPI002DDCDBB4|nr:serine/threonine-protein kinase [Bosea sp. (in: a-proteobacteria)]HEV2555681.1 serine/threonine-protein kinase [Bosea sp. (in: a-proteobacteria)]